jgi:hypothetical protein
VHRQAIQLFVRLTNTSTKLRLRCHRYSNRSPADVFPTITMRAEHLHAKLMWEAAQNEERLWYQERLELVKDVQPESKSAQCMRQLLWDLRSKTDSHRMGWILGNVWSWKLSGI